MKITNYELLLNEENDINYLGEESSFYYEHDYFSNPFAISELFLNHFKLGLKAEENLFMVATNNKGKLLGVFNLGKGTINACLFNIRGFLIRAFLIGAVNVATVHNHPSGIVEPSNDDIKAAHRLKEVCKLTDLNLIDNIIIGKNDFLSFKAKGLI